MNEGAALGHGAAFYGQPLYSYFLAACHWLFGDGLSAFTWCSGCSSRQRSSRAVATAALLFTEEIGAAALVTAVVVAYEKLAAWSGILLTETLFTPLVCAWVYLLVRVGASRPSTPPRDPRGLCRGLCDVGSVVAAARVGRHLRGAGGGNSSSASSLHPDRAVRDHDGRRVVAGDAAQLGRGAQFVSFRQKARPSVSSATCLRRWKYHRGTRRRTSVSASIPVCRRLLNTRGSSPERSRGASGEKPVLLSAGSRNCCPDSGTSWGLRRIVDVGAGRRRRYCGESGRYRLRLYGLKGSTSRWSRWPSPRCSASSRCRCRSPAAASA